MIRSLIAFLIASALVTSQASAASTKFFRFSPDTTGRYIIVGHTYVMTVTPLDPHDVVNFNLDGCFTGSQHNRTVKILREEHLSGGRVTAEFAATAEGYCTMLVGHNPRVDFFAFKVERLSS